MKVDTLLRSLPNFKGKQRLSRLMLGGSIGRQRNVVVKGTDSIWYKIPNCVESIGFELFVNGVYEPETANLLMELLPKNGVYADLGANIGSIALPVAKKRPDVACLCVEASPVIYGYLKFNVERNGLANAVLVNKALSDKDGELLRFNSENDLFGSGHIEAADGISGETVETVRLDSLLEQKGIGTVDVMKVDVEGYEYYAFAGAEKLLTSSDAPAVLFEFGDWAEARTPGLKPGMAQGLLMDFGYRLHLVRGRKRERLQRPLTTGFEMLLATK